MMVVEDEEEDGALLHHHMSISVLYRGTPGGGFSDQHKMGFQCHLLPAYSYGVERFIVGVYFDPTWRAR